MVIYIYSIYCTVLCGVYREHIKTRTVQCTLYRVGCSGGAVAVGCHAGRGEG